ncbi:hypothetical protein ECANGB1_2332 [Enterospora canceri]|uniref:Uncharacterized protein n=1 Tax=Enterospora canceri TaxID=1081671 RepID=A0A1Y1S9D2_9MICR|nr:hypothetical protein ECANGB1_2332 [Enterospora canceri]
MKNLLTGRYLRSIVDEINTDTCYGHLMTVYSALIREIDVEAEEKDDFIEALNLVNAKLREFVPFEYQFYIIDRPIYKGKKEMKKGLFELFTDCIIQMVLEHTTTELTNELNKVQNKQNNTKEQAGINSYICNALFRIRNVPLSPKMTKYVAFALNKDDIKEFLSFIIKMEHKRNTALESNEEFAASFLDALNSLFLAIKNINSDTYAEILKIVHSEKKFFKRVIFSNLPDVYMSYVYSTTRDYNFDVLVSLYDSRPYLVEETILKVNQGELLIPRKSFIDKIMENDKYFAKMIIKLDLTKEELANVTENSNLFLVEYFTQKAGPMVDLCKVLANKSEEFIIEFLENNVNSDNMPNLIRSISYAIKLTSNLKEFILNNFGDRKEYFNALIPFLTVDEIEERLGMWYEKNKTIEALLRKYHSGDLLTVLHKMVYSRNIKAVIEETLESNKFTDSDFIFLLKFLETTECDFKYKTCLDCMNKRKSLQKQCIVFLEHSPGSITNKEYVSCLEAAGNLKLYENVPIQELFDLVQGNPRMKKQLQKLLNKSKKSTKKQNEMKAFLNL